jgi:tellurite resistance protein TehA-like permease
MYQSIKQSLTRWSDETTDRQKLQHTYITVALALLLVAGVLGLVNQSLGQQVLAVAIAAAAVFLINAVAWALLQSFVLLRLTMTPKQVVQTKVEKTKTTKKTTRARKK